MRRSAPDRTSIASIAAVCVGLALGGCATAPPSPPAPTDVSGTVNAARSRGCGAASQQVAPLRADPRLDAVAARLPGGDKLADAVSAERYPAARSASIHVMRAANSQVLYELLTKRFCSDVADPEFETIGVARRAEDLWIVLAVPFEPPAVTDPATAARRALALVNEARGQPRRCGNQPHGAVPPVALNSTLTSVAAAHARDMARTGRMAHEGSDGSTAAERVTRAGYAWRTVAENVAAGDRTAEAVVQTWLASPGHCANLMNPDVREMGIAYAFEASSPKGTYWAQVFATRR
jgi:uncharacterized protein YkwD